MRFALIDDVITEFDRRQNKFGPHDITAALYALGNEGNQSDAERRALELEVAGWEFRPRGDQRSQWGTHYHPLLLGNRDDGSAIYRLDLATLEEEAISHWSERLQFVTNPFLKAHYADLLWDLAHILQSGTKRNFKAGQAAVDAYVGQASALGHVATIDAAQALKRAFQIAMELNDVERIDLVADRLLSLGRSASLDLIGVWVMPSRCILDKRKVATSRHDQLAVELERRLNEAAQAVNGHACAVAAEILCKIYRHESDRDKRFRVLRTLAVTSEKQAASTDAGTAIHWLSPVVDLLEGDGLTEDAERLRLIIEKRGPEALAEMNTVSVEIPVDRQELEDSIEEIIAVDDPFLALFRLARTLSPKCESLRLQVKENEENFIFYSLFPRTIIGRDGQPRATIGSSKTDLGGRMVEEAMHSFLLVPNYFHLGYVTAKKRFDFVTQDLMQIVSASYLCSPAISKCLAEGIQAYDVDDYLKAISVLIPQIESMLRELLTVLELPIRKRVRQRPGFSELKNMSDVLSDPRVENAIEEDLLFLLRIVFTDPRGWNLRNEFAHGALPPDAFNQGTASVVMMAVLLLAMIGPNGFYLSSEAIEDAQEIPITTEASQDELAATPVGVLKEQKLHALVTHRADLGVVGRIEVKK